jgi:hypothetical protein
MEPHPTFRRDKGIPQLTLRDRTTLDWIGQQYSVRLDTLTRLLGQHPGQGPNQPKTAGLLAARNVYRIVRRWEMVGLATYQKFWADAPGWVWLTPVGLKEQGLAYSLWNPRQGTDFIHLHTINEIRFRLEARYGLTLAWQSERQLKRDSGELTPSERSKLHIPDAVIRVETMPVAVQVELTPKSNPRTEKIIRNLLDRYGGVWYFVNDVTEPMIRKHSRSFPKVKVYKLSEVLPA